MVSSARTIGGGEDLGMRRCWRPASCRRKRGDNREQARNDRGEQLQTLISRVAGKRA